ncbi:MAG TPA: hypothetical protein VF960_08305 [Chloroflexota bacterium]
MIDWYGTLMESDYRRDRFLEDSERDQLIRRAADGASDEERAERRPVLGALILAMVALLATGAIGPR